MKSIDDELQRTQDIRPNDDDASAPSPSASDNDNSEYLEEGSDDDDDDESEDEDDDCSRSSSLLSQSLNNLIDPTCIMYQQLGVRHSTNQSINSDSSNCRSSDTDNITFQLDPNAVNDVCQSIRNVAEEEPSTESPSQPPPPPTPRSMPPRVQSTPQQNCHQLVTNCSNTGGFACADASKSVCVSQGQPVTPGTPTINKKRTRQSPSSSSVSPARKSAPSSTKASKPPIAGYGDSGLLHEETLDFMLQKFKAENAGNSSFKSVVQVYRDNKKQQKMNDFIQQPPAIESKGSKNMVSTKSKKLRSKSTKNNSTPKKPTKKTKKKRGKSKRSDEDSDDFECTPEQQAALVKKKEDELKRLERNARNRAQRAKPKCFYAKYNLQPEQRHTNSHTRTKGQGQDLCPHCGNPVSFCDEVVYGEYCVARTCEYSSRHKFVSDDVITRVYRRAYNGASRFIIFRNQNVLLPGDQERIPPRCMLDNSYIDALQANSWKEHLDHMKKMMSG